MSEELNIILDEQELARIKELQAQKAREGEDFPPERQWELDGLLERKKPKK
jgi:hypothetical protein